MSEPHDRLRKVRQDAGYATAADAAKAFGWVGSTYASHENGNRGLRPDAADRYAAAFKTSAAYLLYGARDMTDGKVPSVEGGRRVKHMPYGGMLEAGAFRELEMYAQEADQPPAMVPYDGRFARLPQTSYQVRGDSMNQAGMPEGSLITTVEYLEYCEHYGDVKPGAFVVVERSRDGGQTVERTVKEIHRVKGGLEFRPRSSNPVHKPFIIPRDHKKDDGVLVQIIAVVIGIYHPLSV